MTQFGGLNRCACKVVSTGTGTTFTKVKEYFNVNYIEVLRFFPVTYPIPHRSGLEIWMGLNWRILETWIQKGKIWLSCKQQLTGVRYPRQQDYVR